MYLALSRIDFHEIFAQNHNIIFSPFCRFTFFSFGQFRVSRREGLAGSAQSTPDGVGNTPGHAQEGGCVCMCIAISATTL
jgi:hypothetical protein